ncbi:MAG TPA: hypothetical protein VGE59_02545 [Patescibacteria group bacterium]
MKKHIDIVRKTKRQTMDEAVLKPTTATETPEPALKPGEVKTSPVIVGLLVIVIGIMVGFVFYLFTIQP